MNPSLRMTSLGDGYHALVIGANGAPVRQTLPLTRY